MPESLIIDLPLLRSEDGKVFVDLLETVAYVIADESDLDSELFARIFLSKGVIFFKRTRNIQSFIYKMCVFFQVLLKFFNLIDGSRSGVVTANSLMNFITDKTYVR